VPSPENYSSPFIVGIRGVRGSYPVSGKQFLKYGGNTTCFEIWADGRLIIVDAGTGIIGLGNDLLKSYVKTTQHSLPGKPVEAILLFTHTHIDHIQGLPFFIPIFQGNTVLYIYGPDSAKSRFEDAVNFVLNPPLFPITVDDMSALKLFRNICSVESIYWGKEKGMPLVLNNYRESDRIKEARSSYPVRIMCMKSYAHPQYGVLIYRIEYNNKTVVIATDTEGYISGDTRLIDFARGADLLLHDAGYTSEIYASSDRCKQGYGHSTMEMAVEVARRAQVKQLALIHHEPASDDATVDNIEKKARELFPATCAAYENQIFEV